jgi:D-glycero-D-manno-heptose 1,7-bisphosphate phosphatase
MGKRCAMNRAVFLDRDGVLNLPVVHSGLPYPPQTVPEFQIYPEAPEACALLRHAGFLLVLVTNQPDVGRGAQAVSVVDAMHQRLQETIALDRIEVCTAADDAAPDAHRRKPAPGMLLDAAKALNIGLSQSYMIGDRWRDIDAGHAAGCTTLFIARGYAEKLRQSPHHQAADLLEAARLILSLERPAPSPSSRSVQPAGISSL